MRAADVFITGRRQEALNAAVAEIGSRAIGIQGDVSNLNDLDRLVAATLAGQPRILQNTGTEALETLGELMLYDQNISPGKNQACASCHMPYAGFSGPILSVNLTMVAFPGTVHLRAGKRTPQRHPYAPFFPAFQYNQVQGLFFGGNFWDSRATGYKLRVPDAEQAQSPPVDTQEMGFPDTACILVSAFAGRVQTSL